MEKSTLINKLSQPYQYTLHEKLDIQHAKTHFPYCSLLQQLDLLSDKAASIYQWEERFLARVSAHMPQPERLRRMIPLVETIEIASPDDLRLKQRIEESKRKEYSEEPAAFDIMNEINSYQEVSFKTAPKSEILAQFLEVGGMKAPETDPGTEQPVEDLAKKSVTADNAVITETMAVVYERQGKFDQAISVYEKLIAKYPEKSSTFAARISELKSRNS